MDSYRFFNGESGMMTLEQVTELYASVLLQLLPDGGYDKSPNTVIAEDIYAHAKLLAQTDLDAHRLLKVIDSIPEELINEFEFETGLPFACSTNAAKTFEERIENLKWVRNNQNVYNRLYITLLFAIFDVVLVDVIKFKPIQCTASCTSAVNTEQLRYKVLLRLEYPASADIECIIENYLPAYLRVDWVVDMPWGDWIVNIAINSAGVAKYSAYKTNNVDYYDTTAEISLLNAVIRSVSNTDMQQWQAVKDACSQLTGVNEWFFDVQNQQIKYIEILNLPTTAPETKYYFRHGQTFPSNRYSYGDFDSCRGYYQSISAMRSCLMANVKPIYSIADRNDLTQSIYNARVELDRTPISTETVVSVETFFIAIASSFYTSFDVRMGKDITKPENLPEKTLAFSTVAQKIISNTTAAEPISLHAENYLLNVARSINSTDEQKQFVKISDLISQFEQNKTLRQ